MDILKEMLTQGMAVNYTVTQGIPEDAVIISMEKNRDEKTYTLIVHSDTFKEAHDSTVLDTMDIIVTKIN